MNQTCQKLLVIDDEPRICRLVSRVAERLGFDTLQALDISSAELQLDSLSPTVIVLDLYMPGRGGADFLRDLGSTYNDVPIILISGLSDNALESARILAAQHGRNIVGSLPKPLSLDALSDLLTSATSTREPPESHTLPVSRSADTNFDPVFRIDKTQCSIAGMRIKLPGLSEFSVFARKNSVSLQEQTELLRNITDNLLVETVRQMSAWKSVGLPLFAVVAVSPTLFNDAGIPARLMTLLQEYNVSPQSLALDITHVDLGGFTTEMLDVLLRLRANGFRLTYEFDEINGETMNQAFAASVTAIGIGATAFTSCANDPQAGGRFQAMVALAQRAGLSVWAHGISDSGQLETAIDIGFDFADGDYFAPVTAGNPFVSIEAPV